MIENEVEEHLIRVDAGPLLSWEAWAPLGWVALALVVVGIVAPLFGKRRWLAAAGGGAAVTGALLGLLAFPSDHESALLILVPELGERAAEVGLAAGIAAGAAGGLLLALAGAHAVIKAWPSAAGVVAVVCSVGAAATAGAALFLSQPARDFRRTLEGIDSVPHLATVEATMHTGQSRAVEVAVTELGMRQGLVILFPARWRSPDPSQLATSRRRVRVEEEDLATWSGPTWDGPRRLRLTAPDRAGAFETAVELDNGPVRVSTTLRGTAIEDRGDPLLPIRGGSRLVFARERELRRGREPLSPFVMEVTESVVDGFRTLTLRTTSEGHEPREDVIVAWEGRWLLAPHDRAGSFVERVGNVAPAPGDPPGTACRIPPIDAICVCTERGPERCEWVDSGELGLRLGLGLITLGMTEASAFHGDPVNRIHYTLVEVDGVRMDGGPRE